MKFQSKKNHCRLRIHYCLLSWKMLEITHYIKKNLLECNKFETICLEYLSRKKYTSFSKQIFFQKKLLDDSFSFFYLNKIKLKIKTSQSVCSVWKIQHDWPKSDKIIKSNNSWVPQEESGEDGSDNGPLVLHRWRWNCYYPLMVGSTMFSVLHWLLI